MEAILTGQAHGGGGYRRLAMGTTAVGCRGVEKKRTRARGGWTTPRATRMSFFSAARYWKAYKEEAALTGNASNGPCALALGNELSRIIHDTFRYRLLVAYPADTDSATSALKESSTPRWTVSYGGILPWLGRDYCRALVEWVDEAAADARDRLETILDRLRAVAASRIADGIQLAHALVSAAADVPAEAREAHLCRESRPPPPAFLLTAGGRDGAFVCLC